MSPATGAKTHRRGQAVQNLVAAVSLSLLGLALASGDLQLGFATVRQSPFFGAVLLAAGALFAVATTLRLARVGSRTHRSRTHR